jgi:hypothetical protein
MGKRSHKKGRFRSRVLLPLIAPDGNPAILHRGADETLAVGTQTAVCDFCAAPNPRWVLPVGHVKLDGNPLMSHSDDDWAACDTCKPLIEARNIEALVEQNLSEGLRQIAVQAEMNAELETLLAPAKETMRKDAHTNFTRVLAAATGPIHEA